MSKNNIQDLFDFDHQFEQHIIAGVDEVGRGPLAGPVVCAAVILPKDCNFTYLNDSKKLTENQRIIAAEEIKSQAISYKIIELDETVVDKINILNAAKLGMVKSVEGLSINPNLVLVDGNQRIDIKINQEAIVKGDSKSASIAAASVLAKVYRDDLMKEFAKEFPAYKFESNKGYGSKVHRDAIKKYGVCRIHRRSFLKNILKEVGQLKFL
jgi:ribonuclease HII